MRKYAWALQVCGVLALSALLAGSLGAQATVYGNGCSGSTLTPTVSFTGSTTPGKAGQVHLTGGPPDGLVLLMIGTSDTQLGNGTPLPLDLSTFSGVNPGCELLQSADFLFAFTADPLGDLSFGFKMPFGIGPELYVQFAVWESVSPLSIVVSDALAIDLNAIVTATPGVASFGATYVGDTVSTVITLTNETDKPRSLADPVLFDGEAGDFSAAYLEALPIVLAPGESTGLQVDFTPSGGGLRQAQLEIIHPDLPNGFENPLLALSGVGLEALGSELHVDVGSPGYFDNQFQIWAADFGGTGGAPSSTPDPVAGAFDEGLYQTFRHGAAFQYALPVPDGEYDVTFHFVDPDKTGPGERSFDVALEGVTLIEDLDLVDTVGSDTAHVLTVGTAVLDGVLDIGFLADVDEAIVSALEVTRLFPALAADETELDFGFLPSGSSSDLTFDLGNTGTASANITAVSFLIGPNGGAGDQFSIDLGGTVFVGDHDDVTHPASYSLAPGGNDTVTVTFAPHEHLSNDIDLVLDGDFGSLLVHLLGAGGSAGHPFLHVVIEAEPITVDYDQNGLASVKLDGLLSHTHEPGKTLTGFEWSVGGTPVSTSAIYTADHPVGQHTVDLTIFDDNVPSESLIDSITFDVVPITDVPGVMVQYFSAPGLPPEPLLDAVPAHADWAEIRPQMSVVEEGAVGGSPFSESVMVQMIGDVLISTEDTYTFETVGGSDQRVDIDGVPYAAPVLLTAGLHTVEARFAVPTLGDLPLEVTMAAGQGIPLPIDGADLSHDESNVLPVINAMPSEGIVLGGNDIDIEGFGFFPAGSVTVHWGAGTDLGAADFVAQDADLVLFEAPPGTPGTISVTVETPNGVSNAKLFTYDQAANPPIDWTEITHGGYDRPSSGDWGPDGRFYMTSRWGEIFALSFDDDYNLVTTDTYPGVSGLNPEHETLGLVFNPYDPPNPVRIYVSHTNLYAQGGSSFQGEAPYPGHISVLEGPDFDTPVSIIDGLPSSNHDHGVNGMVFDHNGDLLIAIGGNTNAGVTWPSMGDLPESPLTAAILKAETSRGNFDGDVQYELVATGAPTTDQVQGEASEVAEGSDVAVHAPGLRNPYDLVLHTNGKLYSTDNGPNSSFGPKSTGPDTETGAPAGPDELLLIEASNYYGHANRSRGAGDPRQFVYHDMWEPAIPAEFTQNLTTLSSSTNGITEYRAEVFAGQLQGELITQRWNNQARRIRLADDGRSVVDQENFYNLGALDVAVGPGGAMLGVDYSGNQLVIAMPDDVTATGTVAWDIFPWRAPPDGATRFVIGGKFFGTLVDTTVTIGGLSATVTEVTPGRIRGILPMHPNPTTEMLDVIIDTGGTITLLTDAFRFLMPTPGNEPGRWEDGESMPLALGEVAVGSVNGQLIVVGEGGPQTLAFDLLNGGWTDTLAMRPFVGHHHGAEVVDDKLYLIGGLSGGSNGTVQIYDPLTDSWSLGAEMPWAAGSVATALIDGRIYAAGGIVSNSTVANCGVYDPVLDTWTPLASMPIGRNHAGGGTDGTRFWIFGGRDGGNFVSNGFDDVQVYDPLTDTWEWDKDGVSTLLPLPIGRGGMGRVLAWQDELYVFGGETSTGPGATDDEVYQRVDVYDPETNSWREEALMPTARHGLWAVEFQSRIYLAGGGVQKGNSQSAVVEIFTRQ